jgi:integrase
MSPSIPLTDPLSLAWLRWCMNEGIPTNTVARRLATLRSIPNAGTATREDVETWWTARAGHAPASRANDLANLRSFYRWCRRWEHRTPGDDPTLRIDSPRVEPGLPRPMTHEDLHKALDSMSAPDRRAVCLGAYAGLRISEAAALDWSDVDLENRQLRIMNSKGNKSRRVPISPMLLDALLPNTGGNVVAAGEAHDTDWLARRIRKAFRRAGIDGSFHQLRHRYATIAYQATGDILAVSRLLGHANLNTTQVYVQTRDDVAQAIALAVTA